MKEKYILFLVFIFYLFIKNRETFFNLIYIGVFLFTINDIIYILYQSKSITISKKFISLIKYITVYFISYYLIKEMNPFYHLFTFYLPFSDFFRAVFIITFIDYSINNYILTIISDKKEKENNVENYIKKTKGFFCYQYIKIIFTSKKNFFKYLLLLITIRIIIYFYKIKLWIYFFPKEYVLPKSNITYNYHLNDKNNTNIETKYFIAATLFNMEPTIQSWISEMKKLINYLGKSNVILSIMENNDSTDKTPFYLHLFDNYLTENNISHKFIFTRKVQPPKKRKHHHRIKLLVRLRNWTLKYLYEIKNIDFSNLKIIFFNDIVYRYEDIIKLISTNKGNYDGVCPMDYYRGFYDTWVATDLQGEKFQRQFPFFKNKVMQDVYLQGGVVRTYSCWNGVAVFNGEPFKNRNVYFRDPVGLINSECFLINLDLFWTGYQRNMVNTDIIVTYSYWYYFMNHFVFPWNYNLVMYFYIYFKFFNYKKDYLCLNLNDKYIKPKVTLRRRWFYLNQTLKKD